MVTWGIWYIYEVSLFRLSPRCINLINPKSKPIQLVLSTLVFNILLDVLSYAFVYICSQHACFLNSDLSLYMC